jgi:O-antigen ligase
MLVYPQTDTQVHAQQAHNDYLQLAIEGGLLVVIPWVVAAALLARRIAGAFALRQDDHIWWIRMGAVAGLCGIALQEVSEFSLQIPGVALLFATALAIALHTPAPPHVSTNRGRSSR